MLCAHIVITNYFGAHGKIYTVQRHSYFGLQEKKILSKIDGTKSNFSCLDEDKSRNKEGRGRFFSLQFSAFAVISLKNWCEFPNTVIIASFCKIRYRELFKTKSQASKFAVLLCCISSAFYLIKNVDCDELVVRMGQNWELV